MFVRIVLSNCTVAQKVCDQIKRGAGAETLKLNYVCKRKTKLIAGALRDYSRMEETKLCQSYIAKFLEKIANSVFHRIAASRGLVTTRKQSPKLNVSVKFYKVVKL